MVSNIDRVLCLLDDIEEQLRKCEVAHSYTNLERSMITKATIEYHHTKDALVRCIYEYVSPVMSHIKEKYDAEL